MKKIISDNNKIKDDDVEEIRDFTLLWNLFEALCCDKNANMHKIHSIIDRKIDLFDFNNEKFQKTFNYFYDRYSSDSNRLNALHLRNHEEVLVRKVLNEEYRDKNNKLKFIMAIIYR